MSETPPQILVVEDNPIAREGITTLLRRHGYEVKTTGDGQEAFQYLSNNPPPSVIILDMLLPILDGWAFLEKLKGLILKPKPWIIVTTGSMAIGREWAADHGCAGFLRKPVLEEALLAELNRCLSQTIESELC